MQEAWSGEREQLFHDLYGQKLYDFEIARRMGVTRNTIIGKRMRLGLPCNPRYEKRSSPPQRRNNLTKMMWDDRPPPAPRSHHRKPPMLPFPKPTPIAAEPLRIGILASEFFNCKWVLDERGADGLALVCGLPVHDRSFCQHHFRIVYPGLAAVRRERDTAAA